MAEGEAGEAPSRTLRRQGIRPRKRLGQNFLRDRRYLRTIVQAAEVRAGDQVLEIGAGTGVLTRALLQSGARVVAVELDDSLCRLLRDELGGDSNVEIVHGNALDLDPCARFSEPYKLVGNIPYYITGPILRHYLETPCPPTVLVLMVQREVAERMTAAPGELSLLGVSVQYYAEPRIVARVPGGAFYPRPKVDSAIVRLVPQAHRAKDSGPFFEVARAGFGTRRKQLVNALSTGLGLNREDARSIICDAGIDPERRAETLSIEEWKRLAQAWSERS